jgi:threonine/homoserine/homoserine lactone efflux protein
VKVGSYLAVTAVLVATPGLATAVVVRNAISGGRRGGMKTALGVASANAAYGLVAALGLSVFIAARPDWVIGVRRVGAIYLGYLGLKELWSAVRSWRNPVAAAAMDGVPGVAAAQRRDFLEGFTTNALNPSVAIFYATVVPQFLVAASTASFAAGFALLTALHVTMALAIHSLYAVSLGRLAETTTRPGFRRGLSVVAGVALVVLALRMFV